jgi:hypothetical protein
VGVGRNVKHDRIAKIDVTSNDDLKTKATNALRRLRVTVQPASVRCVSPARCGRTARKPVSVPTPGKLVSIAASGCWAKACSVASAR